jgi:iron complex transport system ATP-binding protein
MLQATDVAVERRRRVVLRQASLVLEPGQVLCLLGANGAGKSTLLSVLAGELRLGGSRSGEGAVTLNGRLLASFSAGALARSRMVLPQKPGLAFDLDVRDVVGMGAYPFPELAPRDVDMLADHALDVADISHLAARRYLELSGGEQQRVQFARVVLQALARREADPQARFLLLDEPTASLDPRHQQALLSALVGLARGERMGVLVILHDVNLAASWGDRIALLCDSDIVACGDPAQVLTEENLRRVYGVDVHVMPHPRRPGRPLVVFD